MPSMGTESPSHIALLGCGAKGDFESGLCNQLIPKRITAWSQISNEIVLPEHNLIHAKKN